MTQLIMSLMVFFVIEDISCQSYTHSPNDTLIAITTLDASVTMNITQIHTGTDTLIFHWEQLHISMPLGWEASICDNSNCNSGLLNSGTTLPVLPGDDGLLLIHCTPHQNFGTGIIQYTIYEEHTSSKIDTLTWIINTNELGVESIEKDYSSLKILQNENSIILYSSLKQKMNCKILDLLGNKMDEFDFENQYELKFSHSGFYFIIINNQIEDIHKIWIQ